MKIHLDTDLGGDPDDLCALALLLAWPAVEITGITTCTEHGGKRAGYVSYALRLAGREGIPVAPGSESGLSPLRFNAALPLESDFWPEPIQPFPNRAGAALDLLDSSVDQGATIVGIGPYTNLALYDIARPGRLAQCQVVLMGGCLPPLKAGLPRWTASDDYNWYMDAKATEHLLVHCRPTIVTLNASAQVHLRETDLPRLRAAGPLGALLARQGAAEAAMGHKREIAKAYPLLPEDLLNFHHDPLACAVALGWTGATVEQLSLKIAVTDGIVEASKESRGTSYPVVREVDGEAFNRMWLDRVAPGC